jgi:hypothetical protein
MEGLYKNLLQYLLEQRGDSYPELTEQTGEYIINNDYLNYFIIFLKSMRYNDDSGVEINYERLSDEMELFKYYSSSKHNRKKLNMFAMSSIAYANEKIDDIDRELGRYCEYFNIPIESLAELLYFSYLIKSSQTLKDIDKINAEAKNEFIKFSFKDSFGNKDKEDIITFEKRRVELLGKIIIGDCAGYPLIETFESKIVENVGCELDDNESVVAFVKGLLNYLVNIRKGRIKTMSYKLVESKLYNEMENAVVEHSNFGKCKIIRSIKNEKGKTIIVNTQLGCYRLEN